nr:unnamed protein product [Digitaria exilis]
MEKEESTRLARDPTAIAAAAQRRRRKGTHHREIVPPPTPRPAVGAAAAAAAHRRPPASACAHRHLLPPKENALPSTLAVARAYTARRLAVGREHLTCADWAAVAAAAPSKTARQCRHKVEKLRRRLRSSRRRPCPLLDAIDLLDGPSAAPFFSKSQSRSSSLSPSPPAAVSPPSPPSPTSSPPRKRRREDAGDEDGLGDVVGALRAIGEGFLRAEERRMEAARETQRMRMEMALRKLDAQRRLMDAFVGSIVDALE